ncbi:Fc.00g096860.m01.CDS01 [Cosmosporella sp. VM-42]
MDCYRLLAGGPGDCESRNHIRPLLQCAFPPICETSETLFDDYEKRGSRMFFSRRRLEKHFGSSRTIDLLLSCECTRCADSRGEGLTGNSAWEVVLRLRDGALLLSLMVYLGKLHFVYAWITSGIWDKPLDAAISHMDEKKFASLFDTDLEKKLFHKAYKRALEMFDPVVFKIPDSNLCPDDHYSDIRRFPFWREETGMPQGSFGKMTQFEILDEYVDASVTERMKDYSSSVTGHGSERKLVFAKKSLKISAQTSLGLERDALRMVSQIKKPASDNIITLLAYYTWRQHVHFVFPYIETDLSLLLRENRCPNGLSVMLSSDESLPDNWLWKQMAGVSRALSAIHTGMINPFGDDTGQVIALHFDLKPANILVTADGTLKITDFGESIIQIVDKGGEMATSFKQGAPRYTAPEARPSTEAMKKTLKGERRDIMVLLNYDVWSLACIMTEVLIYLLDRQKHSPGKNALRKLDEDLDKGAKEGRYFDDGYNLKQCVKSSLEDFGNAFFWDRPLNKYMKEVVDLLLRMFECDNSLRIFSSEVIKGLDAAADDYLAWRHRERDPLVFEMAKRDVEGGGGYREIGYDNESKTVTFVKMDGITLELVEQLTGKTRYRDKSCRIRLFKKPRGNPSEFALVWGVEQTTGIIVKQRNSEFRIEYVMETMIKYTRLTYARGIVVEPSKWCLTPTYLFLEESQFECMLFPTLPPKGKSPTEGDLAFIFGFRSIEDLQTFQGTLLQKRYFRIRDLLFLELV